EPAGARYDPRQLIVELHRQDRRSAGGHRFRQIEPDHGPIGPGAAVGMDVAPGDRPAALLDPPQLDGAALPFPGFDVAAEAAEAGALPGEGAAFALEGVEVEVDVHGGDGLGAPVAPGEPLTSVDGVLERIER